MALLDKDKRKEEWLKQIYQEYPDISTDTLKKHFVEQMVDSYLADEKAFKKQAYKDKTDNAEVFKKAPESIIAITKIDDVPSQPIIEELQA